MDAKIWSQGAIIQMSGAYWHGCALHAAVKLGLFGALGDGEETAEAVAAKLGASPRGTPMLLDAMAALGLLSKRDGCYANTREARRFLCPDSPENLSPILMHHHNLVEGWARLDEAVAAGSPVRSSMSHTPTEPERRSFIMGMHNLASLIAPRLVPEVDLSGRRRLLDFGGGPGTYAIHFCLANPGLSAVVFDLPTTRPYAEETAAAAGLSGRIAFEAGDFLEDRPSGRFDAVWLSHVLHSEGPDHCEEMLATAAAVLQPGGLLMVHEFILDDSGDAPPFAALFSLNMLVGTEEGRSYTEGELGRMMEKAGAHHVRRLPYRSPSDSSIMVGEVP